MQPHWLLFVTMASLGGSGGGLIGAMDVTHVSGYKQQKGYNYTLQDL